MCFPALHSSTHEFAISASEKNRISILCFILVSLQNANIIIFVLFEIEHLNTQLPKSIKGNIARRSIVVIVYPLRISGFEPFILICRTLFFSGKIRSTNTVKTPS